MPAVSRTSRLYAATLVTSRQIVAILACRSDVTCTHVVHYVILRDNASPAEPPLLLHHVYCIANLYKQESYSVVLFSLFAILLIQRSITIAKFTVGN